MRYICVPRERSIMLQIEKQFWILSLPVFAEQFGKCQSFDELFCCTLIHI